MDLVKLVECIVTKLVSDSESISVKEFESNDDGTVLIEVMVPSNEASKVIGPNGNIINSIRTIVQAASYTTDNKKININVDTY